MSGRHASTITAAAGHGSRKATHASPAGNAVDLPPPDPAAARMQRIRELAYRFFEERGGREGHALDDWLQAEAQLAALEGDGDAAVGAGAGDRRVSTGPVR